MPCQPLGKSSLMLATNKIDRKTMSPFLKSLDKSCSLRLDGPPANLRSFKNPHARLLLSVLLSDSWAGLVSSFYTNPAFYFPITV